MLGASRRIEISASTRCVLYVLESINGARCLERVVATYGSKFRLAFRGFVDACIEVYVSCASMYIGSIQRGPKTDCQTAPASEGPTLERVTKN